MKNIKIFYIKNLIIIKINQLIHTHTKNELNINKKIIL